MYYMKVHVHVYRTLAILEVGRRERQVNPDKQTYSTQTRKARFMYDIHVHTNRHQP